ncbi:unnamed protein product [Parascedosporium putredinis]|uniref:Uncharacterized protein n=1 Tax=Parascedosporium putredinis TaxID=1442378 RepID=A0A9P1H157_9PEZI|nr:unnamed protein product [Parascedosporium putredinis]CAI7993452.1 unnamed protein product [Parascedosporium putredinis]
MPILSEKGYQWIQSRTGKAVDLGKFELFGSKQTVLPTCYSFEELCHLPDRAAVAGAVDALFNLPAGLFYPIIDPVLFAETMDLAYRGADEQSSSSGIRVSARACVLVLYGLCSRLSLQGSRAQSSSYADRAQLLLGYCPGKQCDYNARSGVSPGVCIRRGTPDPQGGLVRPVGARHGRRRVHISPQFGAGRQGRGDRKYRSHFSAHIVLAFIKEKANMLLFSPNAIQVPDKQILMYIRELDDEVEEWRQSIPVDLRPKLSITAGSTIISPHMDIGQRIRCRNLQLEYLHFITTIHTAVRRCGSEYAEGMELPEDLHAVFHSSLDIALEASRSTLSLLKSNDQGLAEEPFWRIAFYPPVAAMSLFVNIIIHPLAPLAQKDLELLASSVGISQTVSSGVGKGTEEEMGYLQAMNEFIMELVRLANCAMWKARNEAGASG